MSQAADLRSKVKFAMLGVAEEMRALREHPALGVLLPHYLSTAHSITRATVQMLELACSQAKELAPGDPLAASMIDYLAGHAVEERHHDDWLLEDLRSLGVPASAVFGQLPDHHVAALVGSQWYWIQYAHPVSIYGYMMVVEGFASGPAQVEEMLVRSGLPRRHFKALLRHARLDEHHASELDDAIDALVLDDRGRRVMGQSAMATVKHEAAVWSALVARTDASLARAR